MEEERLGAKSMRMCKRVRIVFNPHRVRNSLTLETVSALVSPSSITLLCHGLLQLMQCSQRLMEKHSRGM